MWEFIYQVIFALVVSYYTRPEPPTPPNPATLEQIDFPTVDEGKEIAVVFGTAHIRSPTVVWYGDLRTTPIMSDETSK